MFTQELQVQKAKKLKNKNNSKTEVSLAVRRPVKFLDGWSHTEKSSTDLKVKRVTFFGFSQPLVTTLLKMS